MSRVSFRAAGPALAAALVLSALPAAAQSVLSSRGLGYPVEALDARARGMGGVTVGLAEPHFSLINPAAPVGLPAPGVSVTFQPDRYEASGPGAETSGTTVRFPHLQVAFPVGARLTGSVGYGAFLDQHWRVEVADSLDLPSGRVGVNDLFISAGALARFRASVGWRASDRLALGLAADVVTGAVRDSAVRRVGEGLLEARSGVTYRYGGIGASAGVRWRPLEALTLAGSVTGGGEITAESQDTTGEALEKSYPRPLEVDAGASARVSQNTVVALSGRWVGWSAAEDELAGSGGAQDAMSASLGVEYEGFSLLGRTAPLRLGARYARLPFRWGSAAEGNEFPVERAVSAGAGFRLAGGLARLDAAAERGSRGGGSAGFEEPFWRFSFSLSVLGR
ncbi:MAG TPA: hypothetical protein VF746_07205 [Longimicrobium sp.]|jgi:hypothetical protein